MACKQACHGPVSWLLLLNDLRIDSKAGLLIKVDWEHRSFRDQLLDMNRPQFQLSDLEERPSSKPTGLCPRHSSQAPGFERSAD